MKCIKHRKLVVCVQKCAYFIANWSHYSLRTNEKINIKQRKKNRNQMQQKKATRLTSARFFVAGVGNSMRCRIRIDFNQNVSGRESIERRHIAVQIDRKLKFITWIFAHIYPHRHTTRLHAERHILRKMKISKRSTADFIHRICFYHIWNV